MSARAWPSREQWARDRRTTFWDRLDVEVSRDPADYYTTAEIYTELERLHARWRELGRVLRALPAGEERIAVQSKRSRVSRAIKLLGNREVPRTVSDGADECRLLHRYQQALDDAIERRRAEILALPVDDDAWAAELTRRGTIEASRGAR